MMSGTGERGKVADDDVAMYHLRKMRDELLSGVKSLFELSKAVNLSQCTVSRAGAYPQMCTKKTYGILSEYLGWPKYQSGRRMPVSGSQQMSINFPNEPKPPVPRPAPITAPENYDVRELIGMPLVMALKRIADMQKIGFRDLLFRVLRKYVNDWDALLSYTNDEVRKDEKCN